VEYDNSDTAFECEFGSPKELVAEWARLMKVRDAEKVARLFHPEAVNLQIPFQLRLEGRDAILSDLRAFFFNVPDALTEVENIFCDGDWVILEWSSAGIFMPTGKHFGLRGCSIFQTREGKIIFQKSYWNSESWSLQIGRPIF
jgi:uncharacterized protein (TIGR02246 family)